MNDDRVSAYINGKYYPNITRAELVALRGDGSFSHGAQSHERRRGYEDMAQDTVQPYNAKGPNAEFYRLYPQSAEKIFTKGEIEEVRRKL